MAEPPRKGANSALRLAVIRRVHTYIAVLIAPTVLLFALTGAVQVFRVPDRHPEMATLNKLASLHKNQTFVAGRGPGGGEGRGPGAGGRGPEGGPPAAGREGGEARAPREGGPPAGGPPREPPKPKPATFLMQTFSALVGLALATTTLLGLWMALAYNREKKLLWTLFVVGALIPIGLVVAAGL